MIQVPAQVAVYVMHEAVSFHKQIEGLGGEVRRVMGKDPLDGSFYVFRSKRGNSLRILYHDGGGFWLCTRRLSRGVFKYWPSSPEPSAEFSRLMARELQVLIWGGNPRSCSFPRFWRRAA